MTANDTAQELRACLDKACGLIERLERSGNTVDATLDWAHGLTIGFQRVRSWEPQVVVNGIEVSKQWAYSEGGRPVIYQPEEEYEQLPESHRWRHVRYELDAEPPIDFSWEREWRIQTDELGLPPGEARIIVPHEDWAEALEGEHFAEEEHRIDMFASVYGEEYRMLSLDPFVYSISIIDV